VSSESPRALGGRSNHILRIQVATAGPVAGSGNGVWASLLFTHPGVGSTGRQQSTGTSRHVVVLIWTVSVSLHVVSVYKGFDPLFQISRL
jgi:hypothetical protein